MWQLMQEFVLWADAANSTLSTNNEISFPAAFVVERVLSAWQSRQKLFFNAGAAKTAESAKENIARMKIEMRFLFVPMKY